MNSHLFISIVPQISLRLEEGDILTELYPKNPSVPNAQDKRDDFRSLSQFLSDCNILGKQEHDTNKVTISISVVTISLHPLLFIHCFYILTY